MKQLKIQYELGSQIPPFGEKINLRWFCEKSGNLIFTLGEGTSSPGAFVLNMATEHVEKVADGVDCDSWKYSTWSATKWMGLHTSRPYHAGHPDACHSDSGRII